MALDINTKHSIATANVVDQEKARRADVNQNGDIDTNEAAQAYARATGGEKLNDIDDVYKVLGGERHKLKTYLTQDDRYSYDGFAKGNFNVKDLGAGHVETIHGYRSTDKVSTIRFTVDCDMFPANFMDMVESAQMVIGPKGFPVVEGGVHGDCVKVPLDKFSAPEVKGNYERSGTPYTLPAMKMLVTEVGRQGLAELAGTSGGCDFYIEVKLKDGRQVVFNKDGVGGRNFELKSSEEFKGLGTP